MRRIDTGSTDPVASLIRRNRSDDLRLRFHEFAADTWPGDWTVGNVSRALGCSSLRASRLLKFEKGKALCLHLCTCLSAMSAEELAEFRRQVLEEGDEL